MRYQHRTERLDYQPCRYGSSRILFRGPAKRVAGEYFVCIGDTETFGPFIETPFPQAIEYVTGTSTINLGCRHAGIDAFNSAPGLIDICSMAQVTVVQIMGAHRLSNRFFTVDPRNNQRFVRASKKFKELYPEVDFTEIETTSDLLTTIANVGQDRLHLLRQEMQSAWVARMRTLLRQIAGKKLLLWMADHRPFSRATGGTICRDPLFVDRSMLDAVTPYADGLVEVIAAKHEIESGRSRLIHSEHEAQAAAEVLGPVVHDRTAQMLEPVLRFLSGKSDASQTTPAGAASLAEAV